MILIYVNPEIENSAWVPTCPATAVPSCHCFSVLLDRFACLGLKLLAFFLSRSNWRLLSAASEAAFVACCNPRPQIPNSLTKVVVDEATNPQHQTRHSVFWFSNTTAHPQSAHLSLFLLCLICCLLMAQQCLESGEKSGLVLTISGR